jgi:hypothetical protein
MTDFKYSEDKILDELRIYIQNTYGSHYGDQIQAQDLIRSMGMAEEFFLGNVIKYASRYGKKSGKNRDDLLKVLHYTILLLNLNDREKGQ